MSMPNNSQFPWKHVYSLCPHRVKIWWFESYWWEGLPEQEKQRRRDKMKELKGRYP